MKSKVKYNSLGEWLRDVRIKNGLSQKELADLTDGFVSSATISAYEADKVKDIPAIKLLKICKVMDVSQNEIRWDLVEKKCKELEDNRLSLYDIPNEVSTVRLFNGKHYEIEGMMAKQLETGDVKPVADIYYQVRSARGKGSDDICAKRKHPQDELTRVTATKYG